MTCKCTYNVIQDLLLLFLNMHLVIKFAYQYTSNFEVHTAGKL